MNQPKRMIFGQKQLCASFSFVAVTRLFSWLLLFLTFLYIPFLSNAQKPSLFLFDLNEFEISHVGFNTRASDIGPSFVGNELWFSAYSARDARKAAHGETSNIYYSIFRTPVDELGYTTYEPRVQLKDIKSGFHEGPVSYCPATGELFVTLSNTVNVDVVENGILTIKQKIRLSITSYVQKDGKWVKKEEMPFNDKVYSVGHPSISPSGDTLFFTSDIPSLSMGGTDIFRVVRKNGIWQHPVALGANVNTEGNEMFPFYYASGILIFASNSRARNLGGLDLYYSELVDSSFTEAKPLDQFNTKYDDFGLIIHPSGQSGYFVSNRPGQNGGDDIYMVKIIKTYKQLKGYVMDDLTLKPVVGAEVTLMDCEGEIIDKGIVGDDGQYIFKVLIDGCYVAKATAPDYSESVITFGKATNMAIWLVHDRSLEIDIVDYESGNPLGNVRLKAEDAPVAIIPADGVFYKELKNERSMHFYLTAAGYLNMPVDVNTAEAYHVKKTIPMMKIEVGKSYVLPGVQFNTHSADITPSTQVALDDFVRLLKENPAIKAEMGAFTDSRGDDRTNLLLSQRRAEAIVDYIVKRGIPKDRVMAKGYGESQLLNRCKNGADCSDEEHAKNNRIEFKIAAFIR